MPTYIRSGSWKQVKEIYVRVGNAWKTVNSAWVRVGNAWKQVHNVSETPYPSGDITIRDYLDVNIIDNDTYIANVGDTIYGHRGPTWINNPTAFQYRWRYATESGGEYQDFSPAETSTSHPSPLNTASPLSRINAWDNRWIVYEVRAQNALGWSEWFTSVNEAHLVKYKPVNLTISITGTPGPFSTLTAVNTWQTAYIYAGDQAPSNYDYVWYDNTTEEILLQTSDPTNTFTPAIEDLNRYVRVEVTGTNSGGSTTAISAPVGPIEFVLAVETPTVAQENGDLVLDNRGGIINGVLSKVSATIYGVTAYTSYRVRYRYRNVQTGTYLLYGASSTATASWITYTSNPSGVGSISSVVVDDVNRVTTLYSLFTINETHYDGSTYTAGSVTNGAKYQVEIQVSVIRPDNSAVSRTLTYGISAAPVPTITTASTTVGTNRDIVFTGTVGGLAGKPAYPTEYFLDFGDSSAIYTELFSEGARNPTYSITHQYEDAGSYTAEVSTNPPFTSATKAITVVLAPGSFNIISVVKGLSNGTTRPLTVTWEQSVNATLYEIQVQRQYSDLSGWVTVQTFADSIYTSEPTRTRTLFISPVAKYYRASVRATRYADLDTAAYSDGGTLTSPVYVEAEGIPAGAPTSITASTIGVTSATISFTAPTSFGSAGLNTYQWSLDNVTWVSTYSSTSPAYVYGLTAGTLSTVYIRALNLDDTGGTAGSVTFTTAAGPSPFNIISATKGVYDSNLARSQGAGNSYPGNGARAITVTWQQSTNATQYEVQIEGRDYDPVVFPGASQTWVMLRELDYAPYINEPTRTETFNAAWYWQYRVTVRARTSGNLASAAYSDGGSSTSLVYFAVTGEAPGKPTIGTITPSKNSASVIYTNPTSTGSANLAFSQWSLDQANWTQVSTSPFTIPNLNSETFYTVYMRSYNYDGISSATPHVFKSFTTPAAKPPNTPTSPTTSGITTTNITFSWTAPSTDSTHNAATGYEYYTNTTGSTPSGAGTPISAPTTSVSFTYTASTSPVTQYFWVRATNADGNSLLTSAVSATPTVLLLAPANSVPPTITPTSGTAGVTTFTVDNNGTWNPDDADGVYEYQWQYYSGIAQNIPGATSSTYLPPSNYVTLYGSDLRCRVRATNATDFKDAFSNVATVAVAKPSGGTITLSPSGTQYSGTLLTATTSGWSGSPTSYVVRIYASTTNPPTVATGSQKAISSTSTATYTISDFDATPPVFYFKAFATATNAGGTSVVEVESNVVTSKLPSASALTTTDSTVTPGNPSSITVANTATTNQGQVTWTNGANTTTSWVSSVTPGSSFTGTDGGSAPTSQTFTITSSATAVATVNNKNKNRKVTVSWAQEGVLSYSANITISGSSLPINGTSTVSGDTSGSSGSFDVTLSTGGGTVKVNYITVYTKAGQTGGSYTFTPATAPSTTPTDKVSTATGSGSVTYTPPAPVNTSLPGISTDTGNYSASSIITGTTGVWTGASSYTTEVLVSTSTPVPTNGTAKSTHPYTITTGDASAPSYYFRIKVTAYAGAGQTGASAVAYSTTSPISYIIPTVSTPTLGTATTTGFTTTWSSGPNNYHTSNLKIYNASQVLITTIPSVTSPYVWSGGSGGNTYYAKVEVVASDTSGTTVTSGFSSSITTTLAAALTPTFGNNTSAAGGFTGSVTNYDTNYTWGISASNGSVSFGTASGSSRPFTVTGLTSGQSSTVTVTTSRTGYSNGSNTTTASATVSAPSNTVSPTITPTSGTAGTTTYTVNSNGTWTNSPTGYTYQWQYMDQPGVFLSISGATSSSYSPPSNFLSIGYSSPIRCVVTASNAGGSTPAVSNTASVSAPAATVPGVVSSLTATSSLSGSNLNWSASWSAPSNNGGSAITGYRVYVERGSSSTGPWTATATQIPAGTGSFTAGSPYSTTSTSVSGRVTSTTSTWIRVYVAAVNSVGVGSYTTAVG